MPVNISHIITEKMRLTPNKIIKPSRVVNFDRFIALLTLLADKIGETGSTLCRPCP